MKVILTESIESLGQIGDVVVVAGGYARNYLLPRKMVVPFTDSNRLIVEKKKSKLSIKDENDRLVAQGLAEKLQGFSCTISAKVSEGDKLYGSVTARDIALRLEAAGIVIDKNIVLLESPIKAVGSYSVSIQLHRDVIPQISVEVIPEQQES